MREDEEGRRERERERKEREVKACATREGKGVSQSVTLGGLEIESRVDFWG